MKVTAEEDKIQVKEQDDGSALLTYTDPTEEEARALVQRGVEKLLKHEEAFVRSTLDVNPGLSKCKKEYTVELTEEQHTLLFSLGLYAVSKITPKRLKKTIRKSRMAYQPGMEVRILLPSKLERSKKA